MDNSTARVDWGAEVLYELYDLQGDTGSDFDFDGCATHMTLLYQSVGLGPTELRLVFVWRCSYSENLATVPANKELVGQKSKALEAVVQGWY